MRSNRINDKDGHERADDAIREFGAVLKATLRTTEVTARVGGDEERAARLAAGRGSRERI